MQNKLHWAIHGHTEAEVIRLRADASRPNMGLRTWKNAPAGPVRKGDISVAKNYLRYEELQELKRIVGMYLDYAEDQAQRKKAMTMAEWIDRLDAFFEFNERNILTHAGKVSRQLGEIHEQEQFDRYDTECIRRLSTEPGSDFDKLVDKSGKLKKPVTKRSVQKQKDR